MLGVKRTLMKVDEYGSTSPLVLSKLKTFPASSASSEKRMAISDPFSR